jgi:hypothetical protein
LAAEKRKNVRKEEEDRRAKQSSGEKRRKRVKEVQKERR